MNRIDRLSAILIQLQSRRIVKAQDIADRFTISLRTVYRDVKALEEAGVPIIGEAGVGYSLVDGFKLPPIMFSREEAMSFLTAEKLVAKLTDSSTASSYSSAMFKVKAVLRGTDKELLESIESHIEVVKTRRQLQSRTQLDLIPIVLESIASKKVLAIEYFAQYNQETSIRKVEPVGVFYLDNYWHLIAFCHKRQEYRDFRMDRISEIDTTSEPFSREHPPLKTHLDKLRSGSCAALHEVVIRVDKAVYKHLEEQKYYNGFLYNTEDNDIIEMNFLCHSLEGFARWYMMFGDSAVIVKPESLKARVKEIIKGVHVNLSRPLLEATTTG